MHGLAQGFPQLAMITSIEGEVLFSDTLKVLVIQDQGIKKKPLYAFWPEHEHKKLSAFVKSFESLQPEEKRSCSNGYLDTEFWVEAYYFENKIHSVFWYCYPDQRIDNSQSVARCLLDLDALKARLQIHNIESVYQLDSALKGKTLDVDLLKNSIAIAAVNHGFDFYIKRAGLSYEKNEHFCISQLDVFHLTRILLEQRAQGNFETFAHDNTHVCHYQCLPISSNGKSETKTLYWLSLIPEALLGSAAPALSFDHQILSLVDEVILFYDVNQQSVINSPKEFKGLMQHEKTKSFLHQLSSKSLSLTDFFDHKILMNQLNQTGEYHFNFEIMAEEKVLFFEVKVSWFLSTTVRTNTTIFAIKDRTDFFEANKALAFQQERYEIVASQLSDIILTLDLDFEVDYLSHSGHVFLGHKALFMLKTRGILSRLGLMDYQPRVQKILELSIRGKTYSREYKQLTSSFEVQAKRFDEQHVPLAIKISPLINRDGEVNGLLLVGVDLTSEKAIEANKQLAAKVFENAHDAIYITNAEGFIVQANQSLYRITGYSKEEVMYQKPGDFSSGWNKINFKEQIRPHLDRASFWEGELLSRRHNGEAFVALMRITLLQENNQSIGMITSFKDITEAKTSEEDIKKLAYFDPLTELPNRALFEDRLNQALQRGSRNRLFVAILFLDLDGFKAVNDHHGHANGDRLLTEVAKRLKNAIRSDDTVARMGGDEFTLILNALPDQAMAQNASMQIANKIIDIISRPFIINKIPIKIGCSIGISLYPDDSIDAQELIKQADAAMYHAKQSGKNDFKFFTFDLSKQTQKRHDLERDLLEALFDRDFSLQFRPVYSLNNKEVVYYNTHIQWRHPSQGVIKPQVFMPMVDDLGIGSELGAWLINKVCLIQSEASNEKPLLIPVFERHYQTGKLISILKVALEQFNIKANQISLELSQDMIMADVGFAYAVLTDIKALQCGIVIADFANSLISLQSLQRLPIDKIKITPQIIEHIDQKKADQKLIKGILAMASCFGYEVLIDGITREEQRQQLLAIHDSNLPVAFMDANTLLPSLTAIPIGGRLSS